MQIKIKRIDTTLPLPQYQTNGSVAFDMYSRETTTILAKELARLPSNLIIATPQGYALIISARSSLAAKKGLMLANGIGLIDNDFCGPDDEILISVFNFSNKDVIIEKSERIAQGFFVKVEQAEWQEIQTVEDKARGGFGSTG